MWYMYLKMEAHAIQVNIGIFWYYMDEKRLYSVNKRSSIRSDLSTSLPQIDFLRNRILLIVHVL